MITHVFISLAISHNLRNHVHCGCDDHDVWAVVVVTVARAKENTGNGYRYCRRGQPGGSVTISRGDQEKEQYNTVISDTKKQSEK